MKESIGFKIKALRTALQLTQEELAVAASTTKQTIHKYETGIISNIPASKIKSMADKLQTTPAYLMGWTESSKIEEDETTQKKNDAITDIILKMRRDEDLLEAIKDLCDLSDDYLPSIKAFLSLLKQQHINDTK